METRKGDWTGTYTGEKFWVLDPKPEEVILEDIVHALSQICRFNGHTKFFYSVAQHSIGVYQLLERWGHSRRVQLYGLLHDASEAYFCDMPRPIKPMIPTYKDIECKLENTIYEHFGLSPQTEHIHYWVKKADNIMLANESKALMTNINDWDLEPVMPANIIAIKSKSMKSVEKEFIKLFYRIQKGVPKDVLV